MMQAINTIKMSLINNLLDDEQMSLSLRNRAKGSDDQIEEEVWNCLAQYYGFEKTKKEGNVIHTDPDMWRKH